MVLPAQADDRTGATAGRNVHDPVVTMSRGALWRILLAGVAALAAAAYGLGSATSCDGVGSGACTRVLFVGNSYTSVNDLPATFAALARAGGHATTTSMLAPGGAYLADEVGSSEMANRLATGWDVVVLQEQSQLAAVPRLRSSRVDPAVRSLAGMIRASAALPVLFMTWAHRDGWPELGLATYEAMQREVDDGYLVMAREIQVPVAPVGYAWWIVHRQAPAIELWQSDGSHPSAAGTYLAACVFYAVIFRQSPEGLAGPDGLSSDDARFLQGVAATTVLNDPAHWVLP